MSNVDELCKSMREVAEAATPGEWHVRHDDEVWTDPTGYFVACAHLEADTKFIALANPQNILALLDERDKLKEAAQNAKGFLDTPIRRRQFAGDEFYCAVNASLRTALGEAE